MRNKNIRLSITESGMEAHSRRPKSTCKRSDTSNLSLKSLRAIMDDNDAERSTARVEKSALAALVMNFLLAQDTTNTTGGRGLTEISWMLATDFSHETKPGTTARTKGESVCVRKTRLGQVYKQDWN